MIDFRYHLVSLVAVFLAVALGIVIGTTQLNGSLVDGLEGSVNSLTEDKAELQGQLDTLQAAEDQGSAYDEAVAPVVVDQRLVGASMLVIVAGEVAADVVESTTTLLTASGAQQTGQITLAPAYSDPATAADLQNYVTGSGLPPGITLPETDDTPTLVGSLLADVLMRPSDGSVAAPATTTDTVLAGLTGLGVLTVDSAQAAPADYALILTSGSLSGDTAEEALRALTVLAVALDTDGSGVVVAGDPAAAGENGLVGVIRGDDPATGTVSTVDNIDQPQGQVAAVLAFNQERTGQSGQYGTAEGTTPIPPINP